MSRAAARVATFPNRRVKRRFSTALASGIDRAPMIRHLRSAPTFAIWVISQAKSFEISPRGPTISARTCPNVFVN